MDQGVIQKLQVFFNQFRKQEYKKGEVLIQADENPTGIFYLEEGLVRRYAITTSGEELMLNVYKPHTFFPMSWAISNVHNIHFYEAMTPIQVRRAPKEDVLKFIKSEPDVLYDLLRRVYIGVEGLWLHIEYLMIGNAYTKLATALVIIAKRFGVKKDDGVEIKMTEKDLATYAGMSRETTSRELHIMKTKRIVSYDKGVITIPDIKILEKELTL